MIPSGRGHAPVAVLVLRDLSHELRALGSQASDSCVDVVDGGMMLRRPSVFGGAFSGSALTAVGVWNFVSSGGRLSRGPHHRDVDSNRRAH
jgi:hypothetical protein